jgi:hypothetical protein
MAPYLEPIAIALCRCGKIATARIMSEHEGAIYVCPKCAKESGVAKRKESNLGYAYPLIKSSFPGQVREHDELNFTSWLVRAREKAKASSKVRRKERKIGLIEMDMNLQLGTRGSIWKDGKVYDSPFQVHRAKPGHTLVVCGTAPFEKIMDIGPHGTITKFVPTPLKEIRRLMSIAENGTFALCRQVVSEDGKIIALVGREVDKVLDRGEW